MKGSLSEPLMSEWLQMDNSSATAQHLDKWIKNSSIINNDVLGT